MKNIKFYRVVGRDIKHAFNDYLGSVSKSEDFDLMWKDAGKKQSHPLKKSYIVISISPVVIAPP